MRFGRVRGCLGASGGVVHFACSPLYFASVFAETVLVANMWWTGITSCVGAISITGLVIGATGRRVGSSSCIRLTIMRSEIGAGATGG